MGVCYSTTNTSGRHQPKTAAPAAAATTTTANAKESDKKNTQEKNSSQIKKPISRNKGGNNIPCGKKTDFGYDKDFNTRYRMGRLLGHGQFGYTYVATDKSSGDRVAVKRIQKSKAEILALLEGANYCATNSLQPVILQSDSQILVDIVNNKRQCPWRYIWEVNQIQQLLLKHHFNLQHIYREANSPADFMAKQASTTQISTTYSPDQIPNDLALLLQRDLLQLPTIRRFK